MKLDEEIEEWAEGMWPWAGLSAKFCKLGEEVGELGESLIEFADSRHSAGPDEIDRLRAAICHEIGDCAIVLSHMARMLGAEGLHEIMEPVFRKRVARDHEARS